jgi:signal transduction histidine kinase
VWITAAIAFVLVTEHVGMAAGAPLSFLVPDTIGGLLFAVAGAVAWDRRPESHTGPILVACAVFWSIGSYGPTELEPLWIIGFAFAGYYDVALAYLALTFPSERLGRAGRLAIGCMAVAFVVRSFGTLFLFDPFGTNPFTVTDAPDVVGTIDVVTSVVIAVAAVTILVMAVRRLWRSPALARAVTWPVLAASIVALVAATYTALDVAWFAATGAPLVQLPEEVSGLVSWIGFFARALVPLGFLAGTLRLRSAGGPLRTVAERLERDATPDEVDAALRAYIENDQLADELSAQLAELRASRARLVAAGDAERQRIERALHDGAQQHLTTIAIRLDEARAHAGAEPELSNRLDRMAEDLREAINELRELARGIHPAILTDAGLHPALATLARRSTVPVELAIELDGRLPMPVEATAYYVAAEALTNVVRSSRATGATVRVARDAEGLTITIADDGVGGADPARGSGLMGIGDRVRALGGRLHVESPQGRGTIVEAWLPCA